MNCELPRQKAKVGNWLPEMSEHTCATVPIQLLSTIIAIICQTVYPILCLSVFIDQYTFFFKIFILTYLTYYILDRLSISICIHRCPSILVYLSINLHPFIRPSMILFVFYFLCSLKYCIFCFLLHGMFHSYICFSHISKHWPVTVTSNGRVPWASTARRSWFRRDLSKELVQPCGDMVSTAGRHAQQVLLGGGFKHFENFHPYLGEISNLTSIFFQWGWNHQLDYPPPTRWAVLPDRYHNGSSRVVINPYELWMAEKSMGNFLGL